MTGMIVMLIHVIEHEQSIRSYLQRKSLFITDTGTFVVNTRIMEGEENEQRITEEPAFKE